MRAIAPVILLLAIVACAGRDVQLPEAPVLSAAEPCEMPAPPPAAPITNGADPTHCLPRNVRARGLNVEVQVSAGGRATEVADVIDLCLVVGRDGRVLPTHVLEASEKQCILADLQEWRFAGVETCRPVFAQVHLGARCATCGPTTR